VSQEPSEISETSMSESPSRRNFITATLPKWPPRQARPGV
jgi:hypothetical protein